MLTVVAGAIVLAGCGGSGSSTTTTPVTPTPVANTVSVAVNSGPANNAVNFAYVSVQICNPGSTTSCATIPDVQVDTGSTGLRILASAPGVSALNLTQVTGSGNPVYECIQEGDGSYLWGPVQQADVTMAGEKAGSLPIQVIDSSATPSNVPSTCSSGGGNNRGTTAALQANGILGISTAQQDCGTNCTGTSVPPYYWLCPTSGACTTAAVPTAAQVSNPVIFFNSDNNGVMLTLNSVGAAGAASATGTLTFGIGTQTDNAIGSSAKVYALAGNSINGQLFYSLTANYNNLNYPALIDSGGTYNFFLDAATVAAAPAGAGISDCSNSFLYCTSSAVSLPVTVKDNNSDSSQITLSIGDATTLLNTSVTNGGANTAFSNLAGGFALNGANDYVNLGMPFFYGRTVYVGISGQAPPSGVSPSSVGLGYWAF
ncbi:MAG: DUF3443 family protein [Terriglobia bacterium]